MSSLPYILIAPNGALRGKGDHPELPVGMDEIVETARLCHDAGAQGIHLHVRDQSGRHTLDSGRYLETIAELAIRVPDLDVQITTEAAGMFGVDAQLACLRQVRPKWASVAVREVARDADLAPLVYRTCLDQGTRVQHILYDAVDAELLSLWQAKGIVPRVQSDRLLVLGRYASGQSSAPSDLDRFPESAASWMVCAFGSAEHACLKLATSRGADIRVGFENSLEGSDRRPWANNAASVAALIETLKGT